jgi:hypothetical protein
VFDSSERLNIPGRIVNGVNTPITFNVPSGSKTGTPIAARIRLSSDQNAINSPIGEAIDGEVEDYMITISNNPYTNPKNRYDVNDDGFVSPIDVLQIVNYVNSGLPSRPPLPPTAVPPYLDVDSDGFIGPLDVLAVITFINSGGKSGSGEGEGAGDDLWISASSTPAPTNGSSNSSGTIQRSMAAATSGVTKAQSLDNALARIGNDFGPALPDTWFDWSTANTGDTESKENHAELTSALDQILDELF